MSAVAAHHPHAYPRGASAIERGALRAADRVAAWALGRAEHRQARREALLARIQDEQTRRPDPRALEHELARMGLPRR